MMAYQIAPPPVVECAALDLGGHCGPHGRNNKRGQEGRKEKKKTLAKKREETILLEHFYEASDHGNH